MNTLYTIRGRVRNTSTSESHIYDYICCAESFEEAENKVINNMHSKFVFPNLCSIVESNELGDDCMLIDDVALPPKE